MFIHKYNELRINPSSLPDTRIADLGCTSGCLHQTLKAKGDQHDQMGGEVARSNTQQHTSFLLFCNLSFHRKKQFGDLHFS